MYSASASSRTDPPVSAFADRTKSGGGVARSTDADDAQADAERSSDAALRRWLSE